MAKIFKKKYKDNNFKLLKDREEAKFSRSKYTSKIVDVSLLQTPNAVP